MRLNEGSIAVKCDELYVVLEGHDYPDEIPDECMQLSSVHCPKCKQLMIEPNPDAWDYYCDWGYYYLWDYYCESCKMVFHVETRPCEVNEEGSE